MVIDNTLEIPKLEEILAEHEKNFKPILGMAETDVML